MIQKMDGCFREFADKHSIETHKYYMMATRLYIIPTENDRGKFGTYFKVDSDGLFKNNSKIAKEWIKLCEENGVKTPEKPTWYMILYLRNGIGERKQSSRMFDIDGVIYGSYSIERDWEITDTDNFQELKASEFWKIVEDTENKR